MTPAQQIETRVTSSMIDDQMKQILRYMEGDRKAKSIAQPSKCWQCQTTRERNLETARDAATFMPPN
jgi:hypothetical protein